VPRTNTKTVRPRKAAPQATRTIPPCEVLTLAEAAAYLRTSAEEVMRLVREQGLPGQKVGNDCRFLKAAIQDWLRASSASSTKEQFWQTQFGALKDDPYLEKMLGDIYQQRGRPEAEE
jgi:excisionase family DNA binding protein